MVLGQSQVPAVTCFSWISLSPVSAQTQLIISSLTLMSAGGCRPMRDKRCTTPNWGTWPLTGTCQSTRSQLCSTFNQELGTVLLVVGIPPSTTHPTRCFKVAQYCVISKISKMRACHPNNVNSVVLYVLSPFQTLHSPVMMKKLPSLKLRSYNVFY